MLLSVARSRLESTGQAALEIKWVKSMSEIRRDPVMGRWVIIAPERALRPERPSPQEIPSDPAPCVFCGGQEGRDPTEIYAVRDSNTRPNTSGWQVRVLPNKYPVLRIEGKLEREGVGMFDMMSGVGAHEVIVETPIHDLQLADLAVAQVSLVLQTYRARMEDLGGDDRFKYVLIFKNQGYMAGATVTHAHSQLIATPVTPKRVKEELTGAQRYYDFKSRCVFCDMIKQETLITRERLVYENEGFVVITPFAARFPYETWLIPKVHDCDYVSITPKQCHALADALKQTLLRMRSALQDPAFNYLIHTAPFRRPRPGYWATIQQDFHWHMEILPRVLRPAGFEEGSGFYINSVSPEDAAETLRLASVASAD